MKPAWSWQFEAGRLAPATPLPRPSPITAEWAWGGSRGAGGDRRGHATTAATTATTTAARETFLQRTALLAGDLAVGISVQ